tara:strand:- start:128 stop:841 length:714 start_codon:yes stop_codon:yes gene_type:complete
MTCFKFLYYSIISLIIINNIAFADHADDANTPDVYKVTMTKLELCSSSSCTTPTILTETSGTFNIASATAGADVGSWITSFDLEVGKTYTHIRATITSTFTISGYTSNASISSSYCVTESSPNTASDHAVAAIIDGSNSTTSAEMSWVVPNKEDGDNGGFYGDLSSDFNTGNITKTNNATTFTWLGTLTSAYTPNIKSAPKIKISFDVDHQLRSQQQAADACYMWVLPPTVSVSLTD